MELARDQRMSNGTRMEDQFRGRKIFVGGLSAELTEDDFKNYFEKFGRVTDVVVMRDSVTKRPRGFGFITFDSVQSVDSVLQNNFHELNGRRVEVKRAIPKKGNYNGGHISKSPLSESNVLPSYPYYSCGYTVYPGFTPFPPYGPGFGLYGSDPYGNWFSPSFGPMASPAAWYAPNFFGMFPPPHKNSLVYPTYSSNGLSTPVAGYETADARRKVDPPTRAQKNMSADAVPFHAKDRA